MIVGLDQLLYDTPTKVEDVHVCVQFELVYSILCHPYNTPSHDLASFALYPFQKALHLIQ